VLSQGARNVGRAERGRRVRARVKIRLAAMGIGVAIAGLALYVVAGDRLQLAEPHRPARENPVPGVSFRAATSEISLLQTPQPERWVGVFVAFPGSRKLCQQHVTGAGTGAPHIIWALYATDRPPGEVRVFYAEHPGKEAAEAPAEVTLRVGKKLLVAYPATSKVHPRCGVEPKTTDQTAIVVSELLSAGQ
jgi:hypothetical protein